MASASLDGVGVLVTRPRQQAGELAQEIENRGGTATLFPAIEIVMREHQAIDRDLRELGTPDITIFVSQNAVEHGIEYAGGQLAAIGPATAGAIIARGAELAIQPASGFDTEHLLAEDAFADVSGKTIRIIRGIGGRETLADTLRERGANVEYLATYERRLPIYTDNALTDLETRWLSGGINAIVVMSVQTFTNLRVLLPPSCLRMLPGTRLVTPAARVLKEVLAQYPGCPVLLAKSPQAADIADCLAQSASPQQPAT